MTPHPSARRPSAVRRAPGRLGASRSRRLGAAALSLGMLAGVGGLASTTPASADRGRPDARAVGDGRLPDGGPQTSDRVRGPLAPEVGSGRQSSARLAEKRRRISPGLVYQRWDQTDARGTVRAYLLKANLGRDGLSLDYVGADQVAGREKMKALVRGGGGLAGVNGDFFDISDTGAPIGVGVKSGATLHGPAQPLGWNLSFALGGDGRPVIKRLPTSTTITARPKIRVNNVNSPRVLEQGIGVYTPRWGPAPGFRALDGAPRRKVRQVVIEGGKVVSNTRRVWQGREIRGRLLLGRGQGAKTLRRSLPVGTRTRVVVGTTDSPRVAISGNAELLRDGAIVSKDDTEMHPRTAVGIDEDGGRLLLLVVDGRQDFSRGYTMLELARMMRDLGAEHALNLDGGGSSTLVARKRNGRLGVMNSPSDGGQRPVPNGLAFSYRPPA